MKISFFQSRLDIILHSAKVVDSQYKIFKFYYFNHLGQNYKCNHDFIFYTRDKQDIENWHTFVYVKKGEI